LEENKLATNDGINIQIMKAYKLAACFLIPSIVAFTISCKPREELRPGEGFIPVTGGKVWYRVVGGGDKTPILLLHGGPGSPSYYLNPLAALGKDRPVIFFDQLGCGRSDQITDTTLMTVENYVEQVEQVRKALGLKDYYLYGHSWGTMLGMDYYLKYPEGIKGIIFSGACISIPLYLKGVDSLLSIIPDSIQTAISTNEKNRTYDAPEYQKANQFWMENFVARKLPWSADMDSVNLTFGTAVYNYMWGPTEFIAIGPLKTFDRTTMLHTIKLPLLFTVGEYDEVLPSGVKYYHSLVPGSKFALIPNAGHATMQDAPEQDVKIITDFLDELEK
jgi:proline iminopeptidase